MQYDAVLSLNLQSSLSLWDLQSFSLCLSQSYLLTLAIISAVLYISLSITNTFDKSLMCLKIHGYLPCSYSFLLLRRNKWTIFFIPAKCGEQI